MIRDTSTSVLFAGGDAVLGPLPCVAVSGLLDLSKLLASMSSDATAVAAVIRSATWVAAATCSWIGLVFATPIVGCGSAMFARVASDVAAAAMPAACTCDKRGGSGMREAASVFAATLVNFAAFPVRRAA